MDLVHLILRFMLATGAEWIMWLLIAFSVMSHAIILERALMFRKIGNDIVELTDMLRVHLRKGNLDEARAILKSKLSIEARIVYEGLLVYEDGVDSVAEAMVSAKVFHRARMEEYLTLLGTMANNAPFVGLFGTVIGIIKAFHDLSVDASSGGKAVMAGISEALVATAIGLFVAIPAVIAYNLFQRKIKLHLASADRLMHIVLADLRRTRAKSETNAIPEPAKPATVATRTQEVTPS